MSDPFDPKEALDKHLTHSTKLSDVTVNLNIKPLKCGFPTMENMEYLLEGEGHLVIMSARPGNGKTALSCQIALNVSEHSKVLYFSLEMKKEALRKRLLAVSSGIPIRKLNEPVFKAKLEIAMKKQESLKLHLVDDSGLTVNDIISKVNDENNREKIALVVIDYIGIIKYKGLKRNEDISEAIIRIKKEIADKYKISVIVLAQMKRGFEERYAKAKMEYERAKQYKNSEANDKILDIRPGMEDLGESSGLEHASDIVMFLQRPCLMDRDQPEDLFKVYVAKNRKGEARDFDLEFSSTLTKFIDNGSGI